MTDVALFPATDSTFLLPILDPLYFKALGRDSAAAAPRAGGRINND
jgi:hypothetical protein